MSFETQDSGNDQDVDWIVNALKSKKNKPQNKSKDKSAKVIIKTK